MLRVLFLLLLSGCANQVRADDAGFEDATVAIDAESTDATPIDAEPQDAEPMDAEPIDGGVLSRRLILPTSGSGVARSPSYRMQVSVGVTPSGVASGSGRKVRLGAGH